MVSIIVCPIRGYGRLLPNRRRDGLGLWQGIVGPSRLKVASSKMISVWRNPPGD
jgi:hypothetical protein